MKMKKTQRRQVHKETKKMKSKNFVFFVPSCLFFTVLNKRWEIENGNYPIAFTIAFKYNHYPL